MSVTATALLVSPDELDARLDAALERYDARRQAERLRPTLSTAEVNVILGFAEGNDSSVPQLVRTGQLRACRVGNSWRFRAEDVDAFLLANASDRTGTTPRLRSAA